MFSEEIKHQQTACCSTAAINPPMGDLSANEMMVQIW